MRKCTPKLTNEDYQELFDALLFTSVPEMSLSIDHESLERQNKLIKLMKQFSDIGWTGSDNLRLYGTQFEDQLTANYLITNNVVKRKGHK